MERKRKRKREWTRSILRHKDVFKRKLERGIDQSSEKRGRLLD